MDSRYSWVSSWFWTFRPLGPIFLVATVVLVVLPGTLPPIIRYGPLLGSILFLGLPHGAVDHIAVASLNTQTATRHSNSTQERVSAGEDSFLTFERDHTESLLLLVPLYVVGVCIFLILWLREPVVAVAVFILLTSFHWGQGDLYHMLATNPTGYLESRQYRLLNLVIRGGIPIFVPLISAPDVYRLVVESLAGTFGSFAPIPDWPFTTSFRITLGIGLGALTLTLFAKGWASSVTREERTAWATDVVEILLLWGFFLIVPPIFAIGVYFAFWHSVRHIRRVLALDIDGISPWAHTISSDTLGSLVALDRSRLARFVRIAGPNTFVALILFAGITAFGNTEGGFWSLTVNYLVVLALLILPHTVVVTWMNVKQQVWNMNR